VRKDGDGDILPRPAKAGATTALGEFLGKLTSGQGIKQMQKQLERLDSNTILDFGRSKKSKKAGACSPGKQTEGAQWTIKKPKCALRKGHVEFIDQLEKICRDKTYKEVDGVYIIYQGHVDIVDPRRREKIAEAQLFETFGESKSLQ